MAINATRPDGATHFNRFQGNIVLGGSVTPPSGEVPSSATIPGTALVKFGPLDMLPNVFDDEGTPFGDPSSGIGPHATVSSRTWAQNTRVILKAGDANITNATLNATNWEIDSTTHLPVLRLDITFAALPAAVDIQIEVPHTIGR